jgi:hypothetical protein
MTTPIALSDAQISAVFAASYPLRPNQRSQFLEACAQELARMPDLGTVMFTGSSCRPEAFLRRAGLQQRQRRQVEWQSGAPPADRRRRQRRRPPPPPARRVAQPPGHRLAADQPQLRRRARARLLLQDPPQLSQHAGDLDRFASGVSVGLGALKRAGDLGNCRWRPHMV